MRSTAGTSIRFLMRFGQSKESLKQLGNPGVICTWIVSLLAVFGTWTSAGIVSAQQSNPTPEMFVPSSTKALKNLVYSVDGSLLAGSSLVDTTVKVFDVRSNLEAR